MNNKYTKRYNLTRNKNHIKTAMKYNFLPFKLENTNLNLDRIE